MKHSDCVQKVSAKLDGLPPPPPPHLEKESSHGQLRLHFGFRFSQDGFPVLAFVALHVSGLAAETKYVSLSQWRNSIFFPETEVRILPQSQNPFVIEGHFIETFQAM